MSAATTWTAPPRNERTPGRPISLGPLRPGQFRAYCRQTFIDIDRGVRKPVQCPEHAWTELELDLFEDHFVTVHEAKRRVVPKITKNRPWSAPAVKEWKPKPGEPGTAVTFSKDRTGTVWSVGPGGPSQQWVLPDEPQGDEVLVLVSKGGYVSRTWTKAAARTFLHRDRALRSATHLVQAWDAPELGDDRRYLGGRPIATHVPGCDQINADDVLKPHQTDSVRWALAQIVDSTTRTRFCDVCLGDPAGGAK